MRAQCQCAVLMRVNKKSFMRYRAPAVTPARWHAPRANDSNARAVRFAVTTAIAPRSNDLAPATRASTPAGANAP